MTVGYDFSAVVPLEEQTWWPGSSSWTGTLIWMQSWMGHKISAGAPGETTGSQEC